jgi:hypothetical protein
MIISKYQDNRHFYIRRYISDYPFHEHQHPQHPPPIIIICEKSPHTIRRK